MSGKIRSLTTESRYIGNEQSVVPSKVGFKLAFGFPDNNLPPDIGVFTFKYREKARVKDPNSATGWTTKSLKEKTKEIIPHRCADKDHNWGSKDSP